MNKIFSWTVAIGMFTLAILCKMQNNQIKSLQCGYDFLVSEMKYSEAADKTLAGECLDIREKVKDLQEFVWNQALEGVKNDR
jgi:hypothetical protein